MVSELPYSVDIMAAYHRLKLADIKRNRRRQRKALQDFADVCEKHGLDAKVYHELELITRTFHGLPIDLSPLSRETNEKYDAYIAYCCILNKRPSPKEYTDETWASELPYPVDIMGCLVPAAISR
jgi:hypothetical protein